MATTPSGDRDEGPEASVFHGRTSFQVRLSGLSERPDGPTVTGRLVPYTQPNAATSANRLPGGEQARRDH